MLDINVKAGMHLVPLNAFPSSIWKLKSFRLIILFCFSFPFFLSRVSFFLPLYIFSFPCSFFSFPFYLLNSPLEKFPNGGVPCREAFDELMSLPETEGLPRTAPKTTSTRSSSTSTSQDYWSHKQVKLCDWLKSEYVSEFQRYVICFRVKMKCVNNLMHRLQNLFRGLKGLFNLKTVKIRNLGIIVNHCLFSIYAFLLCFWYC